MLITLKKMIIELNNHFIIKKYKYFQSNYLNDHYIACFCIYYMSLNNRFNYYYFYYNNNKNFFCLRYFYNIFCFGNYDIYIPKEKYPDFYDYIIEHDNRLK